VIVVMGWAGWDLNPHPLKTKRVRHPTAEVQPARDGGTH
jgi:hypothetical protein